jgi:hypothetical protein
MCDVMMVLVVDIANKLSGSTVNHSPSDNIGW